MGLGNSIGKLVNKLTGASDSSAKSQKYALQSASINNQYQKEFAQNAHQWEVEDLEKAGLNPILSAGGSGASASGGGVNSATQQPGGINPLDFINTFINAKNTEANTGKTNAETKETNERTLKHQSERKLNEINSKIAQIELLIKTNTKPTIIKQEEQKLNNLIAEYDRTTATTGKTKAEIVKQNKENKYYEETGIKPGMGHIERETRGLVNFGKTIGDGFYQFTHKNKGDINKAYNKIKPLNIYRVRR